MKNLLRPPPFGQHRAQPRRASKASLPESSLLVTCRRFLALPTKTVSGVVVVTAGARQRSGRSEATVSGSSGLAIWWSSLSSPPTNVGYFFIKFAFGLLSLTCTVSTDDFAGWLALQTNLALKGIVGINAMSKIAEV